MPPRKRTAPPKGDLSSAGPGGPMPFGYPVPTGGPNTGAAKNVERAAPGGRRLPKPGAKDASGRVFPGADLNAGVAMFAPVIAEWDPTEELGATGLRQWSGIVREELLPKLQGVQEILTYREMSDNDPIVGASLSVMDLMARRTPWRVDPAGQDPQDLKAAAYLESVRHDMAQTWPDHISEALSLLVYGWSLFEIVYKVRRGHNDNPHLNSRFDDGLIGVRKLGIRGQDTLFRWQFDVTGGIQAMIQRPPPDYLERVIPIDKALLYRTTTRKNNPQGRSPLRNAYRCFSADTEILTSRGWVPGLALTLEDEIAVLRDGHALAYERPAALNVYMHRGPMVHLASRHLDQLVTPNHRLWARRDHEDQYRFIEAAEVAASASYKRDTAWAGAERSQHEIPGWDGEQRARNGRRFHKEHRPAMRVPMDAWLTFLGWFYAEGHCSHRGQALVAITQREGPKADVIRAMLKRLPWHVYEHKSRRIVNFEIHDRQLWSHLYDGHRAPQKRLPRWVGDLPPRQIRLLLEAYVQGDGSILGEGARVGDYGPYEGTTAIFTASPGMADDLMELGFKAGYCPKIAQACVSQGHFGGPIYRVSLGSPTERLQAKQIEVLDYDGPVWCPTTATGVVYVRRNGKACWSGNSWHMKKRIEEFQAVGVERDLAGLPMAYVPPQLLSANATANDKALLATIKKIVTNVRNDEQAGVIFPMVYDPQGKPLYEFKLLSTGGRRNFDTHAILEYYDQRIAMSLMTDFLFLGMSGARGRTGSYNLGESKMGTFTTALGSYLDVIENVLNRYLVPRLFDLNGWTLDHLPQFKHEPVENPDLQILGGFIKALSDAGMPMFPDEELGNYLRRIAGMPVAPAAETAEEVDATEHPQDETEDTGDAPGQPPAGTPRARPQARPKPAPQVGDGQRRTPPRGRPAQPSAGLTP